MNSSISTTTVTCTISDFANSILKHQIRLYFCRCQ